MGHRTFSLIKVLFCGPATKAPLHNFFVFFFLKGTGAMEDLSSEDWTPQTLPSWHHSIYVGAVDPWMVISKPRAW